MQYFAVLRKEEFTDLYKFGYFYIRNLVIFDKKIDDVWSDEKLFSDLTSDINVFEYSFEYLLIHFANDEQPNKANRIDIRDVISVYAFDDESKRQISLTYDPRIEIKISSWANKFGNLKQQFSKVQHLKGATILQELFDISNQEFRRCQEIIDDSVVSEVFRELFANEYPLGEKSIWVYLLRYERHEAYHKDMRGFFLDCVHTVLDRMKKGEVKNIDAIENTDIGKEIAKSNSSRLGFDDLVNVISTQKFVDSIKQFEHRCNYQIVAPLFLHFKDKFRDGLTLEGIDYISKYKSWGFDYSLAVYLLGLTLGYEKIYSCYYDCIELPIFKRKIVDPPISNDGETESSSDSTSTPTSVPIESDASVEREQPTSEPTSTVPSNADDVQAIEETPILPASDMTAQGKAVEDISKEPSEIKEEPQQMADSRKETEHISSQAIQETLQFDGTSDEKQSSVENDGSAKIVKQSRKGTAGKVGRSPKSKKTNTEK